MPRESIGEFEQLVLLAILRLGDRAYGVPILEELRERTGRAVTRASVYVALRRLEAKGLVASRLGEPSPERGGRAKRYYRVSAAAVRRLRSAHAAFMRMAEGIPAMEKP